MRLLGLLSWCFLLSTIRSASNGDDCKWQMPTDVAFCTQTIEWRVYTEKQATSTCLEYFPTTFVEGIIDPNNKNKIICTVHRQFQCNFLRDDNNNPLKAFSIFDKCYVFTKKEYTMKDYLAQRDTLCKKDGGLPVFYSMTQGKHIAMEAHRQGLFKMWVNVDKDGRTIDKSSVAIGQLLYSEQWKLHDETYWEGEELKKTPKGTDGKNKIPDTSKYLFFRSKTDYLNNLYQGSFERASETTKASVVCEYTAKIVPDQEKYCKKMQALGLNAMYDDNGTKKRCVYTTVSKYPLMGTNEAIADFKGCGEKPSADHDSGLDDGTAHKAVYDKLTLGGTYRVAAIKMDATLDATNAYMAGDPLTKCDEKLKNNQYNSDQRTKHRLPYAIYDQFGKKEFASRMTSLWDDAYPKSECSDFPVGTMDSNTLAIRNTKIIDVPVPVRLPVLCSISTNVDCGLHKKNNNEKLCKHTHNRDDYICSDVDTWNEKTNRYAECKCAPFHKDTGTECEWGDYVNPTLTSCARLHRFGTNDDWLEIPNKKGFDLDVTGYENDGDRVVVRNKCSITTWAHPTYFERDYKKKNVPTLVEGYGDHVVPMSKAGTSNGWGFAMDVSMIDCTCP